MVGNNVVFFSLSSGVGRMFGVGTGAATSGGGEGFRVASVNNLVSIVCIWRVAWYCIHRTTNAARVIPITQVART